MSLFRPAGRNNDIQANKIAGEQTTNKEEQPMTQSLEWIPVTTLASGAELRVPLHTLAGAQPGPTLGLSALVHGNEPVPSIGIIRAVLERLDASELHGTLLAAPVLNPLA